MFPKLHAIHYLKHCVASFLVANFVLEITLYRRQESKEVSDIVTQLEQNKSTGVHLDKAGQSQANEDFVVGTPSNLSVEVTHSSGLLESTVQKGNPTGHTKPYWYDVVHHGWERKISNINFSIYVVIHVCVFH